MSDPAGEVFTLAIDGADVDLRVTSVEGREAIHAPFRFVVACAASAHFDALSLCGATARLSIAGKDGDARVIEGVVDEVDVAYEAYTFTVVPRIAAAMDAQDHRAFVGQDVIAIAKTILDEHGIAVELRTNRAPPPRDQCLQSFEADLNFVARILAEEGIAWAPQPDGKGVFFADHPGAYRDADGDPLPVLEEGGVAGGEAVYRARLVERAVVDEVALSDYDFERPMLDQKVTAKAGDRGRRIYAFPGGYKDPEAGRALAAIRLDEARQRRRVLSGETNARGLSAGAVITLRSAAREAMNGRFLVVEVVHEGRQRAGGERPYAARFVAFPADVGYRPARRPPPRLGGVQSAVITGPAGAEIHPDEHARVRVKHRWDRNGPSDDTSSAWTRTCQPATSGAAFLPRVGWEALVGFGGPRGDEPMVLGRLYNGSAPPPNGLPGEKVVSAFGTPTSPGGGSSNRVATNDTKGNEGMSFNASSDFNERTENDKVTTVKADDTWTIGGSRDVIVGTVLEQFVSGAETFIVGGSRTVNVTADLSISAASEAVTIGGMRGIQTGGDHHTICSTFTRIVGAGEAQAAIEHQSKFVKGTSALVNGAAFATTAGSSAALGVGGASALRVGGGKSVTCAEYALTAKGLLSEKYASRSVTAGGAVKDAWSVSGTYDVSGAATLKGGDISVKSSGKITIKAGGVTVKMSAGKISITGKFNGSVASDEKGSHKYE